MFSVFMWRWELVPHKPGGSVMVTPKISPLWWGSQLLAILLAGKSVQPQAGVKFRWEGIFTFSGHFFGRNQSINILKFN